MEEIYKSLQKLGKGLLVNQINQRKTLLTIFTGTLQTSVVEMPFNTIQ